MSLKEIKKFARKLIEKECNAFGYLNFYGDRESQYVVLYSLDRETHPYCYYIEQNESLESLVESIYEAIEDENENFNIYDKKPLKSAQKYRRTLSEEDPWQYGVRLLIKRR